MDIYADKIQQIIRDQEALVKRSNAEIDKLPPGHMTTAVKNGRNYYTHVHPDGGKMCREGINRQPELMAQLARKEFLQTLAGAGEKNVQLLHEMMQRYQSLDPEDLLKSMHGSARILPDKSFLQTGRTLSTAKRDAARAMRMESHREWANAAYEQSTYKPEEKMHLTSSGFYVRSKSEVIISEKLFDLFAPFRYEQVLWLDGKDFAPDFTFRDANLDLFFWEHAGMMGDPIYVKRHLYKMGVYQRHGIVPWKNLILTYDTADGAINTARIDSIIRTEVLPRM